MLTNAPEAEREREIEVTSVAQLGSSLFYYEIPGSSYICNSGIGLKRANDSSLNLDLIKRLSRRVEQR